MSVKAEDALELERLYSTLHQLEAQVCRATCVENKHTLNTHV